MNNSHQDPPPFVFHAGTEPLLVSMPHVGTYLPPAIAARLTVEAHRVPDTDWHLDRLYAFAKEMGASILMATHSRYVVDLNRPSDNTSLYPGQSVTTLCPLDTFDDALLYLEGMAPDALGVWAAEGKSLTADGTGGALMRHGHQLPPLRTAAGDAAARSRCRTGCPRAPGPLHQRHGRRDWTLARSTRAMQGRPRATSRSTRP
jgi:hypothetical protein